MRVNESRPAAFAHVMNRFLADAVAFEGIGAIAFGDVQAGETFDEAGNAAAGGLHFNGNGDGVAVVFDEIEERKLFGARGVQRFPEFAFAGGAIAGGNDTQFLPAGDGRCSPRGAFLACARALG